MKPVKAGVYPLGPTDVTVFFDYADKGGSFKMAPRHVWIGLGGTWEDTLNVVLHEAVEFALTEQRCRFEPAPDYGRGADNFIFHMNHQEMGEACGRVAWFLSKLMADLVTHYARAQKRAKLK